MFLHLGSNVAVSLKEIIMVGDINLTSISKANDEFLSIAKEEGFSEDISRGNIKSFIVTTTKVYLSSISCSTLQKRINDIKINI